MTWLIALMVLAGVFVLLRALARKKQNAIHTIEPGLTQDEPTSDSASGGSKSQLEPKTTQSLRKQTIDERLLPKAPSRGPHHPRSRLFDAASARRRFSHSMRCKNRDLSVLAEDPEQLARHGLPFWRNEAQLAEALGLSVGQLRHLSMHRIAERTPHYITFSIPKRSGGNRLIQAPKRKLKAAQKKVLSLLIHKLPVHEAAHGFRQGRSIRTGAEPHVHRRVVIRLDIKDFFPSLTFARIRGYLIAMGYGYEVATTLACLCSEPQRQPVEVGGEIVHVPVGPRVAPQGAPTSPGLLNAICHKLDCRMQGLARAHGFAYTRYADDLTFSGDYPDRVGKILSRARAIIRSEGFEVNPSKTLVMRRGKAQRVTGVTVNETLGLSRQQRRLVRAAIHQASFVSPMDGTSKARLLGKVAYIQMLNQSQAEPLRRQTEKLT